MSSLWIVHITDDDGFIGGVFDNEKAAKECYEHHHKHFLIDTYILKINTNHIESCFMVPAMDN